MPPTTPTLVGNFENKCVMNLIPPLPWRDMIKELHKKYGVQAIPDVNNCTLRNPMKHYQLRLKPDAPE